MASPHDLAIKALGIITWVAMAAACDRAESPAAPASAAGTADAIVVAPAAEAAAEPAAAAPEPARSPPVETGPQLPLLEQQVAYGESPTRNLVGFLAMPADATEPLPAIIVIHGSLGLDDDIKAVTRRLAGEGYVALAVDLYGGVTAETPEQAQPLLRALLTDPDGARSNLKLAYEYLEKHALAPKVASIGWSLGGGWSLQTALMLPDRLDAVVMYYGQVVNRESALETLKMPILGFFGAVDDSIPVREVQYFRMTLSTLGKPAEILIYPGAKQGFASPNSANYDEKAASESWAKTIAFLSENIKSVTL